MNMNRLFKLNPVVKLVSLVALSLLLGSAHSARAQVVNDAATPTTVFPQQDQMELGPVLDVIPYVLSDGYTVNLTLIPTLTAFAGYETPPDLPPVPPGSVLVPSILPSFKARQVITTVNVWDGQTVVLGGLITEAVSKIKDKVPVLCDIPFLGRLFRSESKQSEKKNLMIFVTPTIIDQAGNRLHTEDEMPFAKSAVPAQPRVASGQSSAPPQPAVEKP